jgi:hypothetical protein
MKNMCIEMFGHVRLIIDDIFVVTAPYNSDSAVVNFVMS